MDPDVTLLAAGIGLHLAADAVRNQAWHGIIRGTGCAAELRVRDVQAAAFAGGGVNGVVPARAGDALKLAVLRRRAPDVPLVTLVATLATDSLLEGIAGAALLAWAVSHGLIPLAAMPDHAALVCGGGLAVMAGVSAAFLLARRRAPRVAAGLAVLGRPWALATGVVSWQLLGRALRLVGIACCLAACGLPASAEAALLVMAVEGATRVRLAPLTGSLRLGLLAYGLPAVTGAPAPVSAILAYLVVVTAARAGVGLAISGAVVVNELRTLSPRRLLAEMRRLGRPVTTPRPELERPAV